VQGTYSGLLFHVVDSGAHTANSATMTLTVDPQVSPLSVTTSSLAAGVTGSAYSFQLLTNGGGTGSGYSWAQTGGSLLGSGISLASSGLLTGATPVAGTYPNLVFRVTDNGSNTATSAAMTLTVSGSLPALAVATTALGTGVTGTAYSFQLQTNGGGTGTGYTWTLTGGSLAGSGISLASSGLLSGATPVAGTYSGLQFHVVDSGAHTANSATMTLTVTTATTLTIANANPLPQGTTGVPYADTLTAINGTPPYTFTLAPSSLALPPGLLIDNTDPALDEGGADITDEIGVDMTSEA
jgi:hypothetical protein